MSDPADELDYYCAACDQRPCACEDDLDESLDDDCDWEREDERLAARGTSECDGTCAPLCDWCLAAHACPDDCGGGDACPYTALHERDRP